MENFIQRFNEFTSALNKPGVKVISSDMKYHLNGSGADAKELDADPPVIEFYQQIEYMQCEWVYLSDENPGEIKFLDKDADVIGGSLRISSLSDIVSEEFDIKEGENRFKLFDRISDDRMACLKTVNGIISDEIFWIDYMLGGSPASLNIRMNEYLNIGFNNLFFLNWQQAFLKNDQEKKTFINFYRKQLFTP
jgi:hypothetical protein